MLSRLVFYPTLLYNVVLEKVTGRDWYSRVDRTVILGALPFRSIIPELQAVGVRGLVTMNEDWEMQQFVPTPQEFHEAGIKQLVLATRDLTDAPSQDNLNKGVDFIMSYRNTADSVYVHCKAGRTRSTTLVACYLMSLHAWSPEQAVQFIKTKRPHIWLRTAQLDALNVYYRDNVVHKNKP